MRTGVPLVEDHDQLERALEQTRPISYSYQVSHFICKQQQQQKHGNSTFNCVFRRLDRLTDKLLASIVHKCRPFLIRLNARGAEQLTQAGFNLISGCRNLQDLNLSNCAHLTVCRIIVLCVMINSVLNTQFKRVTLSRTTTSISSRPDASF